MAFLSRLHAGVGAILTFESYADFPSETDLVNDKCLCGYITENNEESTQNVENAIPEYFNYKDTSTRNIYVDASSNMMYRWTHYTLDEWGASHWDYDEKNKKWIVPAAPGPEPKLEDYSTKEEFDEAHDKWQELSELQYPDNPAIGSTGWCYVPCAGGGGSDLYWTKI